MISYDSATQAKPLCKIYKWNIYEFHPTIPIKKDVLLYFLLCEDEEESCTINFEFRVFAGIYFWEYNIKMNSKNNDDEELNYVALAFFHDFIEEEAKKILGNKVKFVMRHVNQIQYFD